MDYLKNDRPYTFIVPYGVAYEEVYEVLKDIESDLRNFEKETNEQKAKDQEKAEDSSSEVLDAQVV